MGLLTVTIPHAQTKHVRAIRKDLAEIARKFGYVKHTRYGKRVEGVGSVGLLLAAIADGEVQLVQLDPLDIPNVVRALHDAASREEAETLTASVLRSLANQLEREPPAP